MFSKQHKLPFTGCLLYIFKKSLQREDWTLAFVVSNVLVTASTIQQPGLNLPRCSWTLLNHFCTDQGCCPANLHRWVVATSDLCLRSATNHEQHCGPVFSYET